MMITTKTIFRVCFILFSLITFGAQAQSDYPNRPVKIIAPQATGGGVDIVGRFMADKLRQSMGQSFIIDNQAGAGGAIAAKMTMRALPDGYTLMIGYVATHGTNPAVKKNIYDSIKDFTPIAMFGGTPNIIVVAKGVPAKNLKELVALAKKQALNYGTSGVGTLNHLLMEQFKFTANMPALMVPYKSIGQAFTDAVGGSVQVIFPGLSAAMPHIRAGNLIPLAVTGKTRSYLLPDVPTFKELGFEGFEGLTWYGLVGPAKLPDDIKKKINTEVNKSLAQADVKKFFNDQALTPMPMSPEQFEDYMSKEVVHWTKVAKDSNIVAD
jgi:tripartite-type tricarboxylate transporter receptor subunit TctC